MQGADNDDSKMGKEIKIFQNALDFSEIRVRDCMIPRTDIEAIEVNKTIEDLKRFSSKPTTPDYLYMPKTLIIL